MPDVPPVEMIPIATAREWARSAHQDGKSVGYAEAVKSLEQSVEALVRLGGMNLRWTSLRQRLLVLRAVDRIEWQTRPIPRLVHDAARASYRARHSRAHVDFV